MSFHVNYSQSDSVVQYDYPFWQPLAWLVSQNERYQNAFFFNPDAITAILALPGLPFTFTRYRVMAIWLVLSLGFLFIWPTKWEQYIMLLVTPLCLCAAIGLQEIGRFFAQKWKFLPVVRKVS